MDVQLNAIQLYDIQEHAYYMLYSHKLNKDKFDLHHVLLRSSVFLNLFQRKMLLSIAYIQILVFASQQGYENQHVCWKMLSG